VRRAASNPDCQHGRVRLRPPSIATAGAAAGGVGLVLVAVGTFLPWSRSGTQLRDSYQSISIIRTINYLGGSPLSLALDAWTMIVPVITLCVATYTFGLRKTAATIAALVAIVCGTIGGVAAVRSSGNDVLIGIAGTGPTVTLIGGALALLGVVGVFAGRRVRATNTAGGEP
jgi:hypothetical protein